MLRSVTVSHDMHPPSIATTLDKETAVIATAAPDGRGGLSEKTDATGSGDGPSESTNGGVFQVSGASLLTDNMLSFPPALHQSARDQERIILICVSISPGTLCMFNTDVMS